MNGNTNMTMNTLATAQREIEAMGFKAYYTDAYEGCSWKPLCVSAEEGDNAADCYGEFRGGDPWINSRLEKLAAKRGWYWDWENAGAIVLTE